jgi:hypothetical protein
MPLRPMLPTILLAFSLSILVAVLAAARDAGTPLALAVGLFTAQILFAVVRTNAPVWRADVAPPPGSGWAWSNAVLAALVYAWGAAAMFAVYSLSGLAWRHWWEYGAAMMLLAAATLLCAQLLTAGRGPHASSRSMAILMGLTALQAVCMGGALVYLIASGKLLSHHSDWAANQIFAAGGVMLVLVSFASLLAYRRSVLASAHPQPSA